MFQKVLIANRGEIAIRVARTLKEMGIGSVAVYSEIDREAPHVREADEAFLIGPAVPAESYLNILKIIDTAMEAGAEAIHPGYGFLAENADFARACAEAGVVFIGPPPEAIDAMGSKTRAREIMAEAGVPIVPGATAPAKDVEEARQQAEEAGYPVACKAAGGGGGKGFRVAMTPEDLQDAFEGAAREGEKFFSDARVYVERYLEDPRHVEVQVLADGHGNTIHLGERDCSVQRRHQKVIEEAPGPHVDDAMRERIGKIATDAAAAVGYRSAGTVKGLQVGDEYFFLEMNTRVQVEHCVTEMVSGIDIVREQILVAAGEPLSVSQEDVQLRGHAIECRINAEAAHKKFAPAPGAITGYREPAGPGVRVDSGVEAGSEVTPMYDPMVAKLIVWDVDREHATRRMLRALDEYEIGGLTTLIPFHKALLATDQWRRGGDLPRPDGRSRLAQVNGSGGCNRARRGRGWRAARPRLQGRGLRQALRRKGDRRGRVGRRRARRGRQAAAETRTQVRRERRRLQRVASLPPPGHRPESRCRAGRHSRRGRPDLRNRGDEDGERDSRPPPRQGHRPKRDRRCCCFQRRRTSRHRVGVGHHSPLNFFGGTAAAGRV